MFAFRVRRKLARWLPSLVESPGRRHRAAESNVAMAEILIDPTRYETPDEFSFVLKPSKLSGIGVFRTHGIATGTRLHLFPGLQPRYFSDARLGRDSRLRASAASTA